MLLTTNLTSLPLYHQGKVRDVYAVGADKLLMISTDRLSAFDVVFPNGIPDKGKILNRLSNFWFQKLSQIVPNHLTGIEPESWVSAAEIPQVSGRAVVVKRLKPLPIEAIVRGYLVGSGWADYQRTGMVCGISLPKGLRQAEQLATPLFTPSSKAAVGEHDENISLQHCEALLGNALCQEVQAVSLALYSEARDYALSRGIIIADTKFEFGLDDAGVLHLMDEALTPDSSRFWQVESYRVGSNPPSLDKQFVRDWLEAQGWNKQPPAPHLPDEIVQKTAERYQAALALLMG